MHQPPLEALRAIVSEAGTQRQSRDIGDTVIMLNDVARAFFEARAIRELCVEIPIEDRSPEEDSEDNVAILEKSLYGTRDAAKNFQQEVKRFMVGIGFSQGGYNASSYFHDKKKLKTIVHGDGFVTV